jgi:hypothetical protein
MIVNETHLVSSLRLSWVNSYCLLQKAGFGQSANVAQNVAKIKCSKEFFFGANPNQK